MTRKIPRPKFVLGQTAYYVTREDGVSKRTICPMCKGDKTVRIVGRIKAIGCPECEASGESWKYIPGKVVIRPITITRVACSFSVPQNNNPRERMLGWWEYNHIAECQLYARIQDARRWGKPE